MSMYRIETKWGVVSFDYTDFPSNCGMGIFHNMGFNWANAMAIMQGCKRDTYGHYSPNVKPPNFTERKWMYLAVMAKMKQICKERGIYKICMTDRVRRWGADKEGRLLPSIYDMGIMIGWSYHLECKNYNSSNYIMMFEWNTRNWVEKPKRKRKQRPGAVIRVQDGTTFEPDAMTVPVMVRDPRIR